MKRICQASVQPLLEGCLSRQQRSVAGWCLPFSDFWKGDIGLIRPSSSELLPGLLELQRQIDALEEQSRAADAGLAPKQAEWKLNGSKQTSLWTILTPTIILP
jgi:hypothetical protein